MSSKNRRQFLQTVVIATGVACLPKPGPAADRSVTPRKFTMDLNPGAIGIRAKPLELLQLAAEHGFESLAPNPSQLASLSDSERDDLLAQLRAKNLIWGAAGLPVDFRRDETTFDAALQRLPGLADALRAAGGTRMSTWLSPSHRSLTYLANFKQHATRLRKIARILDDRGVRFGLEYVGPKTSWTAARHPFVHTMAEARELIAEIQVPNVGLVLDSWHWYTASDTKEELLALTNDDVVACDLNDAPAGIPLDEQQDSSRELPAATGVIDLKTFLGALVQIGYDGPVRAEPFNKELNAMDSEGAAAATSAAIRKAFALLEAGD